MRVFLTGGTGFVGRKVAQHLIAAGHQVRCLVRAGSDLRALQPLPVEIWRGDITEPSTLVGALEGTDALIHLVGIIKEQGAVTFRQIHAEGTRNLLAAASTADVAQAPSPAKHIMFMSAVGTRPDPSYPYFQSKWEAEELVRTSGMPWTILRSSTVFGQGDQFMNRLARILRHPLTPVFPIFGDGKGLLQPIWVDDLARCVVKAVENPSLQGRVFEVGGPDRLSYEALVDLAMSATGAYRPKVHVPLFLVRPAVHLMARLLPDPPITPGQLAMLTQDNVPQDNAVQSEFGINPAHLADKLDYL